jgi:3D (Asp-Asp-Asp) domain-containing protein
VEIAVGVTAQVRDTDGDRLRLRAGPGLTQAVQVTLAEGARVRVVEGPQAADGHQWFRVSAPSGSGWAAARYLTVVEERVTLASAAHAVGQAGGRALQMRVVAYSFPLSSSPRTATGTTPRWGTVAVDPQVIPLGSRLLIEGFDGMVFVAEDTGGAIRGNLVDVWFDDAAAARRFGTQNRTVTILER